MPKYIIYQDQQGNQRKICVIDGQAFYCSTGKNSGQPGKWFPFLMLVGNRGIEIPSELDEFYSTFDIEECFYSNEDNYKPGYIIKYCNATVRDEQTNIDRNPHTHTLEVADRLADRLADRTDNKPQFTLEADTPLIYQGYDTINLWLKDQGAEFCTLVLKDSMRKDWQRFAQSASGLMLRNTIKPRVSLSPAAEKLVRKLTVQLETLSDPIASIILYRLGAVIIDSYQLPDPYVYRLFHRPQLLKAFENWSKSSALLGDINNYQYISQFDTLRPLLNNIETMASIDAIDESTQRSCTLQ